jgi:hypothetical protein
LDASLLPWWRRQQEVQLALRLCTPASILREELDHLVRVLVVVGIGQAHDKLIECLCALSRSKHGWECGPANLRPEQLLLLLRLLDVPIGRGGRLPDRREIIVHSRLLHRQGGRKFLQIDLLVVLIEEVACLEELVLLGTGGSSLLGEEIRRRLLERLLIHHHLIRRAANATLGLGDGDGVAVGKKYVGGERRLHLVVVRVLDAATVRI